MFINIHTHHPTLSSGLLEIESVYFGQRKLPKAEFRSVGLHPWHLERIDFQAAILWAKENATLPDALAIGEAGLDKVCKTPWDLQLQAFQACVELAEFFKKPLIIHCVRAFSEITALKKKWKPVQPWIFHGFDKNTETAEMLLRSDCWLSFGAALFRENSPAAESLKRVPADRFFLETDDASLGIEAVYARAAEIKGIGMEVLKEQQKTNFAQVFGRPYEGI